MNLASSSTTLGRSAWTAAFLLLVTLSIMLGAMPYRGIRHDGILYMGQALSHLNPAWAANDLFFAHGSQDQFSIFSRIVAWLLRRFDAATVDMTLLRGAWLVWLVVLFALVRDFSPRQRWLSVLAVVAASHIYGTTRIFSFLEPFVTARTWAEPVTILALVALLRGRIAMSFTAFALAMALHPLVALPAGAIALAYLIREDRRWAALLLLAMPIAGLAIAGVGPFANLLRTYDAAWFQATVMANDTVYVSEWTISDGVAALAHCGVIWLACRGDDKPFARLGRAALVASPILCLISFVGADVLHNVLVTQLQLWRVTWLLDLLALASLPRLVCSQWQLGPKGRCAAIAVFVAMYALDDLLPTGWMFAVWAAMALMLSAGHADPKPWVLRLATIATVAGGMGIAGLQVQKSMAQMGMHEQGMKVGEPFSIFFATPLIALPAMVALIWLWERGTAPRAFASAAALALFGLAATHWDQRSPWARYVESASRGAHPFAALIPPDAQVYWHEQTAATWILLQRANFMSLSQASGLLFNRETAMEALERIPAFLAVMVNTQTCANLERFGGAHFAYPACELPRQAFLGFCKARPTHPDFLVATTDFGTGVIARWTFDPRDGSPPTTYALYDCSKLQ
ncbi:MAG: hypothetical protein ABIR54_21550 [Burkholderiaceae bacterium]